MKVQIRGGGRNLNLRIPTALCFGKATVWLANHVGRKYAPDALKDISPEALDALFAEFRRFRKKHRSWVLVDVESSSGEMVKIIL